jgi:hypothetical protein
MKHRSRSYCRGYLLMEVVFWLAIIGALLMLITQMMVSGLQIYRETTARNVLIGRVDVALDTMRRDAWRAESIQALGDQVAFVEPDGVIFWRMEAGGVLTRVDPARLPVKKTWNDMPRFSFSASGPLLKVDVASGPEASRRDSITLASQRMLAGGVP